MGGGLGTGLGAGSGVGLGFFWSVKSLPIRADAMKISLLIRHIRDNWCRLAFRRHLWSLEVSQKP